MNCTTCNTGLKFIDGTNKCTDDSIKNEGYYESSDGKYN